MDDILAAAIIALALWGIIALALVSSSFTLYEGQWQCTEVTITKGKPECLKYERKEVKP